MAKIARNLQPIDPVTTIADNGSSILVYILVAHHTQVSVYQQVPSEWGQPPQSFNLLGNAFQFTKARLSIAEPFEDCVKFAQPSN